MKSLAVRASCLWEDKWKILCQGSVKCKLVDYDSLPSYLKDNEFIRNYYRAEWPLKQTILSLFSIHNETLDIWTHLIGFFIFLGLTMCAAVMLPANCNVGGPAQHSPAVLEESDLDAMQQQLHVSTSLTSKPPAADVLLPPSLHRDLMVPVRVQSISRWPFFAFMCGVTVCLLTSSASHLLSCHSRNLCYVMHGLDYIGISTLIVTSFYPLVYYTFTCDPFYRDLYIGFITTFGMAVVCVSLMPVFQTQEYRMVRSGLFFCMGVSGIVPIMHKLIAFSDRPEALVTAGHELVMGGFYVLGVAIYCARVPERWMPGKFDLVGHSHQLFHVLVVAGAYTHYLGCLVYLRWRDAEGC